MCRALLPVADHLCTSQITAAQAVQSGVNAAANSAALSAAWSSTPDDTDVPGAPVGSRSAKNYADKAATSAAAAAASVTSLAQAGADGRCVLAYNNATSLVLMPQDGGTIYLNGQIVQLPAGGVMGTFPNQTALWNVYLVLTGNVFSLAYDTTGYAPDQYGRKNRVGDASRRWVGKCNCINGQTFDDATRRYVFSAFNKRFRSLRNTGSGFQTSSTGTPALVGNGVTLVTDGSEPVLVNLISSGRLNQAGTIYGMIGNDGSSVRNALGPLVQANVETNLSQSTPLDLAEGIHTIAPLGQVSGGTGTYATDINVDARM